MTDLSLISWNINGFRSSIRTGFWDWFKKTDADIVCLQETKIDKAAFDAELGLFAPTEFHALNEAHKKGYSGVATFSKTAPLSTELGLGIPEYDTEGRLLFTHYKNFTLVNCYIPNGQRDLGRVPYKLEFSDALIKKCEKLRKTQPNLVLCGDFNVAHQEIDIKNPKSNKNNSGFTQPERDWMTKFLGMGYIDTFRHFHPEAKDRYTWWSYRPGVREKNIGWCIDYFIVTKELLPKVRSAQIFENEMGSDHCPIGIVVSL